MTTPSNSNQSKHSQAEVPELQGTATEGSVASAFSRDSQAKMLFAMFARTAEIEGYAQAAQAFRELTESQAMFADGHLDILKRSVDPTTSLPVGDTVQNLRVAIAIEQLDTADSLVLMARTAHSEGFPDIASWFETLAKTKRAHLERLEAVLGSLSNGPKS